MGDISSSNPWAIGVDYRFSPMRVYAEIFDEDVSGENIDDSLLYTVGIRYDFYALPSRFIPHDPADLRRQQAVRVGRRVAQDSLSSPYVSH